MRHNYINPVRLPYSDLSVQTYYERDYGRPGAHRFRLGHWFTTMDEGIAAVRAEFVNPEFEEELALSGIREYVTSMRPVPGGTGYDKQYGRHYLIPDNDVNYQKRTPYFPDALAGNHGPYHTILGQRVSTFDFAPMVAHVMTNTDLQDEACRPIDPRLTLVEEAQARFARVG